MTTYTLTGDLGDLIGDDPELIAARLELVNAPYAVEGDEVRFPVVRLTLDTDGTFTQAGIPSVSPTAMAYQYRVVAEYAPSEPGMGNEIITIGPFELPADADLGDLAVADIIDVTRGGIDHGDVSGTLTISSGYGLHEMNITGPLTLTPSGPVGADMAVRVTGDDDLALAGATWDSDPLVVPGIFLLTHWAIAGWCALAVAPVVEPPAYVTFAADPFTVADSTVVNGRVTPTGALTWSADDNGLTVQGNRAQWPTHGASVLGNLINAAGSDSEANHQVRFSVDYDLSTDGAGSVAALYIGGNYRFGSGDQRAQYVKLLKSDSSSSATITLSLNRQAGGEPTLTAESGKSLTGHPNTGKVTYETVGNVVKIYIDDVLIAQATSTELLPNSYFQFWCQNRTVYFDNVVLENLV